MLTTLYLFAVALIVAVVEAAWQWQQITLTGSAISARAGHAGAYMNATNELLIWAGSNSTNGLNDMHSINLGSMIRTLVSVSPAIGARTDFAWATNPNTGNLYIYGGLSTIGNRINDLWTFDAQTRAWTSLLASDSGGSARSGHCMVMDIPNNRLIIFGGTTGISTLASIRICSLSGTVSCSASNPSNNLPPPRIQHACALNSQSSSNQPFLYVQGGIDSSGSVLSDLWRIQFGANPFRWNDISPNVGASNVQLSTHSMEYLPSLDVLWVFLGKLSSGYSANIYQYSFGNTAAGWTVVNSPSKPTGRSFASITFKQSTGEYFLFGGQTALFRVWF
jgi:hypothetical protein